ncbi:MAG: DUF4180 domain-containing protein [Anaerolineales bacterium]|nr:DUF4180 domain-containing protein [Anaerolineales bacterium]
MKAYYEWKQKSEFDPADVFRECVERGADSLLISAASLPEDFFDLSSGLLGELLHKLSTYRIKMALVVPDTGLYSPHFQAFARETNQGKEIHVFSTREEAVKWLDSQ